MPSNKDVDPNLEIVAETATESMAETTMKGADSTPLPNDQDMPTWMKVKKWVSIIMLGFLPLFGLFYFEIGYRVNVYIIKEVYTAIVVGVCQFLIYLHYPAKGRLPRGKEYKPNIIDLILGTSALIASFYLGFNWMAVYVKGGFNPSLFEMIIGVLFIIAVLESARRIVGVPLMAMAVIFLLYAKFGNYIPGLFHTAEFKLSNIIGYIYLTNQGIFGSAVQIIAGVVLAFTTFSVVLQKTNAGRFYLNISLALMGRLRGGAAKVAIFCSMLFATMTGEPTSNLGIIAPLSVPFMKKMKYEPVFSGAVLAVSSCGSMIMPPVMGAVVFLMSEVTGISYPDIMLAAIVPAVLYYLSVFLQVDFYCAKKKMPRMDESEIPKLKQTFKEGWYFIIPVISLIAFLLIIKSSITRAVYYSLVVLIVIAILKKEDRKVFFDGLWKVLPEIGRGLISVIGVTSCSGIIMAIVSLTGVGLRLTSLLTAIAGGSLIILALLAAVTIYIMGMGMAPIVSYILMSILVAPAIVNMGVPVIAAHFFILYMAVSGFITPPVAVASYVAGGIVGESGIKVGFRAMRLGIVCYMIPFVALFGPALLLVGSPFDVITACVSAILGVVLMAGGLEGYLFSDSQKLDRAMCFIGGFLMFIPNNLTTLVGLAIGALAILLQYSRNKKIKQDISPSL